MQVYEGVLIFDVQMADDARDALLKDLDGVIAETGGAVREVVPFGIRTLAMDIKGRQRGDYRIVRFTTGGETLQRVDRMLKLKEEVLRYMVVRYQPPKPRRDPPKKPKKAVSGQTESEGEVGNGKSEQSVADRQSDTTA